MERLEEYASLLVEIDAPFKFAIEKCRVDNGIPREGFTNIDEFNYWQASREVADKMWFGKLVWDMGLIVDEYCKGDDSFSETAMHYLLTNQLIIPISAATILVDRRNMSITLVIHGKTNLKDIERAWKIIRKKELKKILSDKGKLKPEIVYKPECSELDIVITSPKTTLESLENSWREIEKRRLRKDLPDFKQMKFEPIKDLGYLRDAYVLHEYEKMKDKDISVYFSPSEGLEAVNETSVAVFRKRFKGYVGIKGRVKKT